MINLIKSKTTLRNKYGKISTLAHEGGAYIYITKNGEDDLIVDSQQFQWKIQGRGLRDLFALKYLIKLKCYSWET